MPYKYSKAIIKAIRLLSILALILNWLKNDPYLFYLLKIYCPNPYSCLRMRITHTLAYID